MMRKMMWRKIGMLAVMLLCVFSFPGSRGSYAYAKNVQSDAPFSGHVEMLKHENNNYVMQVTVENGGEDFTGTVQVIFGSLGYDNCAYNTEITLPAQGKKQFTFALWDSTVDIKRAQQCVLNVLDEKGNVLWSQQMGRVFGDTMPGISVGILSDNYAGLTFLDAGGEDFDIRDMSAPLNLIELNQENLGEHLDGLYFLIIDQFQVASLRQESIASIQDWVNGGGCLLIGTGAYAEQTLSGFDADFIDVDVAGVSQPGGENMLSAEAGNDEFYYTYTGDGIDFTNVAVADLDFSKMDGRLYGSTENPAVYGSFGDGAVSVFSCSLGEEELQKLGDFGIRRIYEELYHWANDSTDGYSGMEYLAMSALSHIDNVNTNVDFTWLKWMIFLYVVLVGPALYLLLRKCKKCEWYWICAPALGILFIAGVFFLGRGVRVNETKVYSVTVQRADDNRADTYFLAYHAGVRPWKMHLRDTYEVAGPSQSEYYYYGNYGQSLEYYRYIVGKDSQGLSVGLKPSENFENGFFYAAGRAESRGTIFGSGLKGIGSGNARGTITNGTDCDMSYMAVYFDSYIMVFSGVKAGETLDLQQAVQDGRCLYEDTDSGYGIAVMNDVLSSYKEQADEAYQSDDLAALLIGLYAADDKRPAGQEQAAIVGVVRDYDKAVTSKCKETSYGCLYSYAEAEMGEGQDASN